MTTRSFLLDMLDDELYRLEELIPAKRRTGLDYLAYNTRKAAIEKARRLVEKGPDEPC